MKIDSLIANLEKNTEQQNQIIKSKLDSVTTQHIANYNQILSENEQKIESILESQLEIIKQQSNEIKSAINYKMLIGGVMGLLLATMLGLGLFNLYLYKNIGKQQAILTEIQQSIEQSPLQAQALSKVEISQNPDKSIWITPRNPKKAEVGKLANGKPTMKLE